MRRSRDEEDWDPMEEAFFNENFNSYKDGPGAQLESALQPCFSRRPVSEKPLCKLYVHKIPSQVNESALRNLFQKFGRVISFFKKESPGNYLWALVEYQTSSEGQAAISGLNGQPPLYLAVQFAMSEREKQMRKREKEEEQLFSTLSSSNSQPFLTTAMETPYPRALGRGRGIPIQPRPSAAEIFSHRSQSSLSHMQPHMMHETYECNQEEDDYVLNELMEPGAYAPYKGGGWDAHNAFLMDRVSLRVNASNTGRRISLGRASSAPRGGVPRPQGGNYDLRYSDIDERGFPIGKCSLCNDPSTLTCEVCGTWYCSPKCQQEDWPRHKAFCNCFRKALNFDGEKEKTEWKSQGQEILHNDGNSEKGKARPHMHGAEYQEDCPNMSESSKMEVDRHTIHEMGDKAKWEEGVVGGGHDGGGRSPSSCSGGYRNNRASYERVPEGSHPDSMGKGFERSRNEVEDHENEGAVGRGYGGGGRSPSSCSGGYQNNRASYERVPEGSCPNSKGKGFERSRNEVEDHETEGAVGGGYGGGGRSPSSCSGGYQNNRASYERVPEGSRPNSKGKGFERSRNEVEDHETEGAVGGGYGGGGRSPSSCSGGYQNNRATYEKAQEGSRPNSKGKGFERSRNEMEDREKVSNEGEGCRELGTGGDWGSEGREYGGSGERRGGRRGTGSGRGGGDRIGRGDGREQGKGGDGGEGRMRVDGGGDCRPRGIEGGGGTYRSGRGGEDRGRGRGQGGRGGWQQQGSGGGRQYQGRGMPRDGQRKDRMRGKEPTTQLAKQVDDDEEEWGSSKKTTINEDKDRIPVAASVNNFNVAVEKVHHKCEEHVELPLGKFVEVSVESTLSHDTYWITCKDYMKDAVAILGMLQKELSKPSDKTFVPHVGSLCIASYEGLPFRAKVKSIKGSKANVFYIDYGNTEERELAELIPLPQDALELKSQAVQMVLSPDSSQEFMNLPIGAGLTVKAIRRNKNGVVLVEPKDDKKRSMSPPVNLISVASSSKETTPCMQLPPSIIDHLQEGVSAICMVNDIIEKDPEKFSLVVMLAFEDAKEYVESILRVLPTECQKMRKNSNFKPSLGQIVVVDLGEWKRGIILGRESMGWKIMLCDEGIVVTEKEVQCIPERFQNIPYLAASCHVIKSFVQDKLLLKMVVGLKLNLKVLSKNTRNGNTEVVCDVTNEDGDRLCCVKMLPRKPELGVSTPSSIETETKPCSPPENVVLKNGATVQIVHYFSLSAIYVQLCDRKSKDEVATLLQSVAEACIPVGGKKPLREIPVKGSIVGCKYETDGNHYRALVGEVKSHDKIHVSYIDFGNLDVVNLDLMCDIPESLKRVPAQAVRIALKDSFGDRLNQDAIACIYDLIMKNEELKFVCPDGNLKSCDLLLKNGVSVNEKIKERMEASWKPPRKPTNPLTVEKVFDLSDLEEDVLPVPSDGESYLERQLMALSTPGKAMIVVCRNDNPHSQVVYGDFQMKINKYCEEQPKAPYVPRSKEMCFAKFSGDGMWYRAHSVECQADESMVFFVDYGNWELVKHINIRKMAREFMEVPLLAIICNYKGFMDETISKEAEERLKKLIQPCQMYSARVWRGNDSQDCEVDFPEVTAQLIAEKHLDAALFRN